mgnify:CR=1 FL=1
MTHITITPESAEALKAAVAALSATLTKVLNPVRVMDITFGISIKATGVPQDATEEQVETAFESGLNTIKSKALAEFNALGRRYGVTFSDIGVEDVEAYESD